MESIINQRIEAVIKEAQERGDFDSLPGAGKAIDLNDEYSRVPQPLRMGYKILKNAGFLPPELEARKEATQLMDLLETLDPESESFHKKEERLEKLRLKMEIAGIDTQFLLRHLRR